MYLFSRVAVYPTSVSGVHPFEGFILDYDDLTITVEHTGTTSYTVSTIPLTSIGRCELRGPGLTPSEGWSRLDSLRTIAGINR